MIFIIYNLTFLPYILVFKIDNKFYNRLDDIIDVIFIIDIII